MLFVVLYKKYATQASICRFCGLLLLLLLLLLLYCVASRLLVLCQQTGENLGGAIGGLLAHWWVALVAVGAAVLV